MIKLIQFSSQFQRTCYIIRPLRVLHIPYVRVPLRIIFTLHIILSKRQCHESYNMSLLVLLVLTLNNLIFLTLLSILIFLTFSQISSFLPLECMLLQSHQKNWRPKAKHRQKPIAFIDVDDNLYVLRTYRKTMKRSLHLG